MPRYYDVVTQDELKSTLCKFVDKYLDEDEREDYEDIEGEDFGHVLSTVMMYKSGDAGNDINKIQFDFENSFIGVDGDHFAVRFSKLFGLQTLGTLSFYGMWAGGDWEYPVYFILYQYKGKIRGYVPEDGNTYNIKTKAAYGNDEEEDEKELQRLGLSYDDVAWNQDKILVDIQGRLKEKV